MSDKKQKDIAELTAQLAALDAWDGAKKRLDALLAERDQHVASKMDGASYTKKDLDQLITSHRSREKSLNDKIASLQEDKKANNPSTEKTVKVMAGLVTAGLAYLIYMINFNAYGNTGDVLPFFLMWAALTAGAVYTFFYWLPPLIFSAMLKKRQRKCDASIATYRRWITEEKAEFEEKRKKIEENMKTAVDFEKTYGDKIRQMEDEVGEFHAKYRESMIVPIKFEERQDLVRIIQLLEDGSAQTISEAIRARRAEKEA